MRPWRVPDIRSGSIGKQPVAEDASAGLSDITDELVARRSKLVNEVAELVGSGVIGKNPRLLEAVTGMSREMVDAA